MFKHYRNLSDVVSLLIYCPSERTFLVMKENNGEYWIPSYKAEKNCWQMTAHKIYFDLFGMDTASPCLPIRIYKIWLPLHNLSSVYHAVYKLLIKSEYKKKTKLKQQLRSRLVWVSYQEIERQRAHSNLRSPELAMFALLAMGEQAKEDPLWQEFEGGLLRELCEDTLLLSPDVGAGATALAAPNFQLLQAASYTKEDQIRLFREFMMLSYPAMYMSPQMFTTLMTDIGWQRALCPNLFRAADVSGRGGLSFQDLVLWCAAMEPGTPHGGVPAELRCRYIFRYFDSNRDMKLEYQEFKELVAAARTARQLQVDALSVARDADVCLRQLGLQPNSQLPLSEFLRGVGELRLRGTSSMLRAPRSIAGYLMDLQERDISVMALASKGQLSQQPGTAAVIAGNTSQTDSHQKPTPQAEYNMATFSVRVRREAPNEMMELHHFDEDAVSPSTTRMIAANLGAIASLEVLGPSTFPVEAMAAVHYFATAVEKCAGRRSSMSTTAVKMSNKAAWSWVDSSEEAAMGNLLLKLADALRPICHAEPRLLRFNSPVYAIGDLHGNLNALLAMEMALWPSGAALSPAKLLFLGDFVDRGPHGAELMAYLMAAKLQRPHGVLLIRGNHETRDIQKMFTFHTECLMKYGEVEGGRVWSAINAVFDVLPLAAVIDEKVFCCHGGIPPPWVCPLVSAIDKIPVPLTRPAEQSTIAWELLWNDPVKPNKITATLALELTANEGFAANSKRGTGHVFDQTALERFLLANQLSHVVRAHELHQNGFLCQLRGRLISVFSSSHYCGGTNDSGVALLEGNKVRLIRVGMDFSSPWTFFSALFMRTFSFVGGNFVTTQNT